MSDPRKQKRDLVIIGGGAGGLVVASVAAQLGLDEVLIEKNDQPGGDCLHYGCVPSKALLNIAHMAHSVRQAPGYGIEAAQPVINIATVNASIRRAITKNSTARFARLVVYKARLLGAYIVGPRAGDVIHEHAPAMNEKIKLSGITALVHAYPSYAQLNRRAAGAYYSPTLYSNKIRWLVKWLLRLLP